MAALDPAAAALLFDVEHDCRATHRWKRLAWRCKESALDLFFPPHCASCGMPLAQYINKAICRKCTDEIRWIGSDCCVRCGDAVGDGMGAVGDCVSCRTHPPRFVSASAATFRYEEGPGRDLVLGLKFGARTYLARALGRILALRIRQSGVLGEESNVVLVPTPMMRGALFKRGYNQAEELAGFVARELKLKLDTRLLKKIRATHPQAMLSAKRRRENLIGAFACDPKRIKANPGATVLLIDDVITTGSTVSECARTLHQAGIKKILAACVARG